MQVTILLCTAIYSRVVASMTYLQATPLPGFSGDEVCRSDRCVMYTNVVRRPNNIWESYGHIMGKWIHFQLSTTINNNLNLTCDSITALLMALIPRKRGNKKIFILGPSILLMWHDKQLLSLYSQYL